MTIHAVHASLAGFPDITSTSTINSTTTALIVDSPWQPAATRIGSSTSRYSLPVASRSEGWFHWRTSGGVTSNSGANQAPFTLFNTGSGLGVLRLKWTLGLTNMQAWNGSAWVDLLPANVLLTNAPDAGIDYDIYFKLDNTVGEFSLYANGILNLQYIGDTIRHTDTTIDRIDIKGALDGALTLYEFGQLIVADESTAMFKVFSATLDAAGAATAWTGAYTDVDEEAAFNDVDLLTTSSVGDIEQASVENIPASYIPPMEIHAVQVNARARTSGGAPTKLDIGLRSNGTNYWGATKTLTAGYIGYSELFLQDPDTGYDWTLSAFNAIQAGIRSAT